jgi:hypothetical protein
MPFESKDFEGVDIDGDGYARFNAAGMVVDCNDLDPEINPSATDDCDGLDSNCNGIIDDQGPYYYADRDGDGYGRPDEILRSCEPPAAYVTEPTDCDDEDASRSPGSVEVCDGKDNDCNNLYDDIPAEGAPTVFYIDSDGDGFGDGASPLGSCDPISPPVPGAVQDNTDCQDDNGTAYPGSTAFEVTGDGIDQDCDGTDACTDLDCDGIADVVVGWTDDGDLPWLEGEPGSVSGVLALVLSDRSMVGARMDTRGPDGHTADYLTSDVNQDGYLDVVQAVSRDEDGESSEQSFVHFGPFASTLPDGVAAPGDSLILSFTSGAQLAVGDFNGSGVMDVVVGATAEFVGVSGTAVFVDAGAVEGGSEALDPDFVIDTAFVHAMASHDLDQDGFDDLVICHGPPSDVANGFSDYDLLLFFGGPTGLALSDVLLPTTGCLDLAVGNLDTDAQLEMVVARGFALTMGEIGQLDAELIDVGADQEVTVTSILDTPHAGSVQLVDVDADSDLDVVFGGGPLVSGTSETDYSLDWETEIQIHFNVDGEVAVVPDLELSGYGAMRPVFGHFNSDSNLDLIAPGQASGRDEEVRTLIYYGTGSAEVYEEGRGILRAWQPWVHGTALDYNEDGYTDIIATGVTDGFGLKQLNGAATGLTETATDLLDGPVSLKPPIVVQ